MKRLLQTGFAVIWAFICLGCRHAPVHEVILSKEEIKAKQEEIWDEINRFGKHEWAGKYVLPDRHGATVLLIAPRAGFMLYGSGTLFLPPICGKVTFTSRRVVFDSSTNLEWTEGVGRSHVLVPVHWGPRLYLIPEDRLVTFCNSVNQGRYEERLRGWGEDYFLRDGDETKPVSGFPEVPARYRPYLLARPIEGRVIEVVNSNTTTGRFRIALVTLDAGRKQGVLTGMEFTVVTPDLVDAPISIIKVEANRCEGVLSQYISDVRVEPTPAVGWTASTRLPWLK